MDWAVFPNNWQKKTILSLDLLCFAAYFKTSGI